MTPNCRRRAVSPWPPTPTREEDDRRRRRCHSRHRGHGHHHHHGVQHHRRRRSKELSFYDGWETSPMSKAMPDATTFAGRFLAFERRTELDDQEEGERSRAGESRRPRRCVPEKQALFQDRLRPTLSSPPAALGRITSIRRRDGDSRRRRRPPPPPPRCPKAAIPPRGTCENCKSSGEGLRRPAALVQVASRSSAGSLPQRRRKMSPERNAAKRCFARGGPRRGRRKR